MFKLLSSLALVQAAQEDVEADKKTVTKKTTTKARLENKVKHRFVHHRVAIHKVHHINGVARLHYCLNSRHHVVPCSHVMDNFGYSRSLIASIMKQLPRFVHKHTVVYRMYTTLKLYYLHQQELLSEILSILKLHMHSKSLARVIFAYIRKMHGGHYGWVGKISTILKSYMKMNKNQMHSIVQHHRLVYQLHSIIRHAATHSHRMIHKLFHVMKNHGFAHHSSVVKTFHKMMRRHVRIVRKIKHTRRVRHTRTVVRSHKVTKIIKRSYHFKSSKTTKSVVKKLLKVTHSRKATVSALKKIMKKQVSKTAIKNLKKAIKKVTKMSKKAVAKKAKK